MLVLKDGNGQVIAELAEERTTVGRTETNDVVLPDPSVSGFHAIVLIDRGSVSVVDLASTNGTFVDGERVAGRRALRPRSTLRMGRVELEVEKPGDERTSTMELEAPPEAGRRDDSPEATAVRPAMLEPALPSQTDDAGATQVRPAAVAPADHHPATTGRTASAAVSAHRSWPTQVPPRLDDSPEATTVRPAVAGTALPSQPGDAGAAPVVRDAPEGGHNSFKGSHGHAARVKDTELLLVTGDITEQDTDAIVNAANRELILGGGVAGAIRRKGGDSIQSECDQIGGTEVGGAVITGGGNLKARHVIHAVGPRMGEGDEDEKLGRATRNSLILADSKGLKSIAFPAISTGVFGFPAEGCARIMLEVTGDYLSGESRLRQVVFCLYDPVMLALFEKQLASLRD